MNYLANDLDHILDHTRSLWDELRGEQIFITGGTGFFGIWLLESFLWANQRLNLGARATLLTRSPQAFTAKLPRLALAENIRLIEGDIRSFDFPSGNFTHIIHAATDASAKLNAEDPLLMLDTIVDGTRHTLDFSLLCGARKFLLTSSGAVYGKQPSNLLHIPEEYTGAPDPLDPKSAYGQGKRLAEHLNENCALLCICWSILTARYSLCNWQFYTRRFERWPDRYPRRWYTTSILPLRSGPNDLAMDYPI
jgi:dTDP-glucose 4,6-dehydratase